MKASLGSIILNVALIHGAGLVLLTQQAQPAADRASVHRSQPVQVRFVQALPRTTPATTAEEQPVEATEPVHTEAHASHPVEPEPRLMVQVEAIAPPTDEQAVVEEYIPRPRLSTAPLATRPVIVPFPAEFDGNGRYSSVLSLYIDEDGIVRRVRFDDAPMPPSMKDAARQAFLQAHFKPGQVQGQKVKSLIQVEVVFDNTPIESDTSYTVL